MNIGKKKSEKDINTKEKKKQEIAHLTRFAVSRPSQRRLDVSSQKQSVARPSANNLQTESSEQKRAAVSVDNATAAALIKTLLGAASSQSNTATADKGRVVEGCG